MMISFLFMLVFGHITRQEILTRLDNNVEIFASSISRVLDDLMRNNQTEEIVSTLGTLASNPAILGADIFKENGELFISYGITPGDGVDQILTIERFIFKRFPDGDKIDLGRLHVYYTHATAEKEFRNHFLAQLSRMLLIIVAILVGAIYAFSNTVSRPLKQLLDAIRETNVNGKWVLVNWESKDEIGEVINAHNSMIKHIARKEAALEDSERRHRELFNNAQAGIFQIHPDGIGKEANNTLAHILGYPSAKELASVNVLDHYVNADDREKLWQILREFGEISHFKTQFRRCDGNTIWVELSGKLTTDGSLNGILQDVTAQVEAGKALEERDELHRAFFEENKAAMLLHDPMTSSIQFVNPAACQFYGYTNAELTSMTIRELDCMTDAEIYEELQQAANERRSYFKHVHTLKDGTQRHVEVFTGPVSISNRQLHYSIIFDVTEKRRLEAKLERMATRDQLTGAYNRHAFFQMAKTEIARAKRFNHPLTMLMFDLDHFKDTNDTFGHATGDEVLRVFALRCRAGLRQNDIFARLGGEEFAALLIETDVEQAMEVAERIRMVADTTPIPTEKADLTVTTSIGVSSMTEGDSVTDLLTRADEGLYKAKETGRNSVVKI
ncbi:MULTISPECIES: sensor domain-containing diguanylate cyclase [unclassified Pseudodesulfovibrio]|uniref:sensor domain-containing diguanylate cyclase n=1 Tax=unclassified Pseudodesulfovibrio TaxID=2661612 RepID=UPI0013E3329F|nr:MULTISPECIES: sensor domain-containing diguanylate cyclase [unclassified Pseudodesulfovibrio]MCJ2165792.1 diguanylate cyclase [Pseudodesulfovibrio sp. S3-i]